MTRRWGPGTYELHGMRFRVVPGRKEDGDLRLEWSVRGEWRPVKMAVAAFLVDFFVENEEHLRQFRPHWRSTGEAFFIAFLRDAVARGWQAAAATLERQRASVQPEPVALAGRCSAASPDGADTCEKPGGHVGPHASFMWGVWPVTEAA